MDCPKCSTATLAFAAYHVESYTGVWCPACGWTGGEMPTDGASGVPEIMKARHTGVPHEVRVERDGSVRFTMRLPDGALEWCATASEIRAMATGLGYVVTAALRQKERLSGADRWAFKRSGDGVVAAIHGEQRALDRFTVGQRHRGRAALPCSCCARPLVPGTKAYRPADPRSSGRVVWRETRFCDVCAEAKPRTGPPTLRSINGGLAKKTGIAS